MFRRYQHKFEMMYAKRAYVHIYLMEGMEEADFAEARRDYQDLLMKYKEFDAQAGGEKEDKEWKIGDVIEETIG